MSRKGTILNRIDKPLFIMYLLLLVMGISTVYAVNFKPGESSFFNLSLTHGRQMTWMAISVLLGLSMLTFNSNFFTRLPIPFYLIMVVLLLVTLVVAREINGARSWLQIGPIQFQPAEFAKTATALMLAKYISGLPLKARGWKYKLVASAIILLPMGIIVLQQDVGSALVYFSLSLVLFREGFRVYEVLIGLAFGLGFILSLIVPEVWLLWIFSAFCLLLFLMVSGRWFRKERASATVYASLLLVTIVLIVVSFYLPAFRIYLIGIAFVFAAIMAFMLRGNRWISFTPVLLLYVSLTAFTVYASGFVMESVLQPHQSQRVLTLFGLSDDPDANYNVTQSKMTIGSGGLAGKGYLQGTLTQLEHVPEQTTDFIFCTIGEELGFMGTAFFLLLYLFFILRLTVIAERQRSVFTRIYCYSVAAIFFIQVMINVGMTIGLLPVIGIPLPFISYGGSSVLAFSIMVFIVLRLDADRLLILR